MTPPSSNAPIVTAYRCGPAVINVAAEDPGAARWLQEFLTPWFEAGPPAEADITVHVSCSAAAFAYLEQRRAGANPHPTACFRLDSQVLSLPGWVECNGSRVIADRTLGCFYQLRPRRVDIVAPPASRLVRYGLMRVVRELTAARILGQGTVLDLHAAALGVERQAVLLAGAKGAGKTTLLVHALASGRASLIANDRVFVEAAPPPTAIGVPTLVALREDTLRLFPHLRRGFPKRPALLTAAELDRPDMQAGEEDDGQPRDFALSPAQFAGRLGVATLGNAPIAAIVFPEITPAVATWALEPITPAERIPRLRQCLYGDRGRGRSRTIFEELIGLASTQEDQERALVDRVATLLPLLRCRLGPDAYAGSADAWLRALPLQATGRS